MQLTTISLLQFSRKSPSGDGRWDPKPQPQRPAYSPSVGRALAVLRQSNGDTVAAGDALRATGMGHQALEEALITAVGLYKTPR